MKTESNVRYILRLTVTLLLITAFVAAALAGVNAITKDKIAAIKEEKTNKAMKEVLSGYESFEKLEATAFTGSAIVKNVYIPTGGDGTAYVVEVAPVGFGGEITMMVGVRNGAVTGVSVVSQTETAGLGAVSAENSEKGKNFRGQFEGMDGQLTVGTNIEAITGATITSKAVTEGVNAALAVQIKG